MPRFTDEQVDAARMALPAFSFPTPSQMRAALNAAADAAPEPDTTEFERQLDSAIEYGVMVHEAENVAAMAGCGWSRAGDKLVADYETIRRTLLAMFREAGR